MGSSGFNALQARVRRSGTGLVVVALSLLAMLLADPAQAVPLVPLDAVEQSNGYGYGFDYDDPDLYPFIDPSSIREFTTYYQAGPPGNDSLFLVEALPYERCSRSSDDCSIDSHVFDVEWKITFNANALDDPTLIYNLDLILVDSSIESQFDGLPVAIDYASATLDGSALDFETANLIDSDYYFVDLILGSMLDGESKIVGFRFHVDGELPFHEGEPGFEFPVILPGGYATPIPEPSTVSLLGLGLAALARRRRRA